MSWSLPTERTADPLGLPGGRIPRASDHRAEEGEHAVTQVFVDNAVVDEDRVIQLVEEAMGSR